MHDLVHLAVGRGGGVDGSGIVIDHQRLHLQLLRRKNDARLAIGSELVDTRRRSGRGIGVALVVGSNVPQIGGRRGVERAERGASVRLPSLLMATPCAVPFSKSSYLVCSQVRVACASRLQPAKGTRAPVEKLSSCS